MLWESKVVDGIKVDIFLAYAAGPSIIMGFLSVQAGGRRSFQSNRMRCVGLGSPCWPWGPRPRDTAAFQNWKMEGDGFQEEMELS